MIGLAITFLSGRYHANPWQHAHNEGRPEWPPSPWRLLRALVAAAYEANVVTEAAALLQKLHHLPRYQLPAMREAHLRHYMPNTEKPDHAKAKVFDNFVVVDGGSFVHAPQPVIAVWPVQLSVSERVLLEKLAAHVRHVGRLESWAECAVVDVKNEQFDCYPTMETNTLPGTSLMALEEPEAFTQWAAQQPAAKKKGSADVPRTQWDVLTFTGERVRDEGWTKVPGTRLVRYTFAERQDTRATTAVVMHYQPRKTPTVARYAIRSAVLPKMTDALLVAERVRTGLMSQSKAIAGNAAPVFSGHFEGEAPPGHPHAFILASADNNHRGYVDHLTVTAQMGFTAHDVMALQSLSKVYGRDDHFLELILVSLGTADEYGGLLPHQSPLLAKAHVWQSVTPFVPTRHPKLVRGQWQDGIAAQISKGCVQLGLPEPLDVSAVEGDWHTYRRRRVKGHGNKGPDKAYGARLVFAEPVQGPIALGYGAHFGLGVFEAVKE